FARRWVANRTRHRPRGERMLRQELFSKGVDRDVIEEVLAESEVDEYAGALELGRKRLARLSNLEPGLRHRRLTEYLARRGYDWDTIRQVTRDLKQGEDEEAGG
ncbi:MAG: regulatory protein RecX, partial [Chloroflexota bacterium]